MKIFRGFLFSIAALTVFQCTACKPDNGDAVSDNTTENMGSNVGQKMDSNTDISVLESEQTYYYYTAQHNILLDKNESIYDGEWCLGANGIYYGVDMDLGEEKNKSRLCFISYDDIKKMDDINDLFLGTSEVKSDNLDKYEYDISTEGLEGALYKWPCAYKDGAMVFASLVQADGTGIFKAVYIDENMKPNIIDDITDMVVQADNAIKSEDVSGYINKFYGFEDENGTIYCIGYDSGKKTILCFFDAGSKKEDKLVLDYSVENMVYDGVKYINWLCKTSDEQMLVRYNIDEGAENMQLDNGIGSSKIYGCKDSNTLWTQSSVYVFDMHNNIMERMLDWNVGGVKNGLFDKVYISQDKTVFGASLTTDGICITGMYKSDVLTSSEKEILRLAVYAGMKTLYDEPVRLFNASNSRYQVELVEYADSSQFITGMASKDAPDMISADMINLAQFSAGGYLTDLYELMERDDSRVKAEDLLSSVADAYTYNGKLVAVPVTFTPKVIVGGDELENIENWNIDEFINLINRNDKIMTNYMYTTENYITDLALIYWVGEKDRLLDWENKAAHFNSDNFIAFLKALENYTPPVQMGNIAESVYWQKNEIYLHEDYILPYSMQIIRAVIGTKNPVYVGYPTGDKTTFGVSSTNSFAINAGSSNKEGAWEFLQYIIRNADSLISDTPLMAEFPIYLPKLNDLIDKASVKKYKREKNAEWNIMTDSEGNPVEESVIGYAEDGDGGVSVDIYALDDKDRDELWYILDNIGFVEDSFSPAYKIYMEEIISFMSKTQDAQQTADALQDRMTLMLEESE